MYLVGAVIAAYAGLEGVEAVGLWYGKRWAEYLTFVATIVFVPYEIHELIKSVTALKVVALIINVAIAVYLLYAKRLFGLRGGGRAERAEREADTGWTAIERATPRSTPEKLLSAVPLSRPAQPSHREPRAASTRVAREPTAGSTGVSGAAVALSHAASASPWRKRVSWPNPCRSSRPRRW